MIVQRTLISALITSALAFMALGCQPCCRLKPDAANKENPEITSEEIIAHIQYLASDDLEGRFPDTPGSNRARDYIKSQWRLNRSDSDGYNDVEQSFDFVSGVGLGQDNYLTYNSRIFTVAEDYIPIGFSGDGVLSASVVFAGFGFVIDDSIKWNDYTSVDVNEKWVMILRGGPEDSPHSSFGLHEPLRKKTLVARDRGAGGVLFVSQDADDELIKMHYDNSFSGAGIPVLHISRKVADAILGPGGKNIASLQSALIETKRPLSFELPEALVSSAVSLNKVWAKGANLIAYLPGHDPEFIAETIVIGGHYDHLGYGGPGSGSLAPDTSAVHNGADDNASGIAAIIEIVEKLAGLPSGLRRSLVVLGFDAEEKGLLGSRHYVENPFTPLNNTIAMINIDMIGRAGESGITVGGTGTSPEFEPLLNETNIDHNLNLKFSPEGYGPSDHASFYKEDIPVLFFFTGTHEDYHKPSDDWDQIDPDAEKLLADFIADFIIRLDDLPQRPEFTTAGPKEPPATRRQFKVTFGVIPAYGSQAQGMEIDGVRPNGPAARAGLMKGDIIIAIDGKEIKDIYDYMYRLGELEHGQTVDVDVRRGEIVEHFKVTL
jgi:hypothetical protein